MDQSDPAQAASLEDLASCLRHLRTLADTPTYRELERRTIRAEGVLPGTDLRRIPLKRATIADVLAGHAFPRKAFLLTFAEACGVDLQEDRRWERAWNRLALRYRDQLARGGQVYDHLASATHPDGRRQTPGEMPHPGADLTRAGAISTSNTIVQPWVMTDFLAADPERTI
jgi:hypothetical protein